MESLYRKYRPKTFDEVVGQQHVVSTLKNAVLDGRISHAYLFCGPRGTGKTTMARILAKALLCEEGPGKLPDGTCEQCQLIAAGEHPDVYELDAASRTGVDNVREEIITRVDYAPVQGSYKVYIIDEVHMLTTQAFNALLKTLEEPPDHVVFILCTTDPQKIPETILSRVQRFDFHAISNEDICTQLEMICSKEGFTCDHEALELIAQQARGGMRDAITKLDQLATFSNKSFTADDVRAMFGEVPVETLEHMSQALAARDVATLFADIRDLADKGTDFLQFARELAAHIRDVYVVAVAGTAASNATDAEELAAEARAFGEPDRLARALAILGDAASDMRTTPNQRLVLELACTKIARPQADLTLEALAERVSTLEQALQQGVVPQTVPAVAAAASTPAPVSAPAPAPQPAPEQQPAPVPTPPAPVEPTPAPVAPEPKPEPEPAPMPAPVPEPVPVPAPAPEPAPQPTPSPTPAPAPEPVPASAPAPAAPAAVPDVPADVAAAQRKWREVIEALIAQAPAQGSLITDSVVESDDGTTLTIMLTDKSSFALRMLERPDVRDSLGAIVSRIFGSRTLVYKTGAPSSAATQPAPAFAPFEPTPEQEPVSAAPELEPTPVPAPESASAPIEQSAAPSEPAPPSVPAQPSKPAEPAAIPESLTSMLEDVFGKGVSASTLPAAPAEDTLPPQAMNNVWEEIRPDGTQPDEYDDDDDDDDEE